ncbi:unnamed protein product, partial [marine sediment metagenome]
EPSAKVIITNVSDYLWQTKGTGVELWRVLVCQSPEHKVTMKVAPPEGGTATIWKSYLSVCLVPGFRTWVNATPNEGWVFSHWSKPNLLDNADLADTQITMPDNNIILTAYFSKIGEQGEDGCTPEIITGTWWICDVDTGIPATGEQGEQGEPGCTPEIINGYWFICGEPTGIPATGNDGDEGPAGDDGNDGVVGPVGPQGPAGEDGEDLTLPEIIHVYYTIANTGNVNIQEYTITFKADTASGVYTGIVTGTDLKVGEIRGIEVVEIKVFGKKVRFVDYSLELE